MGQLQAEHPCRPIRAERSGRAVDSRKRAGAGWHKEDEQHRTQQNHRRSPKGHLIQFAVM